MLLTGGMQSKAEPAVVTLQVLAAGTRKSTNAGEMHVRLRMKNENISHNSEMP